MTPPRDQLGERMASLEATVDALKEYESKHWHGLDNKLQPLFMLPERLTREIAKMQGIFDGKIGTVSKDLERSIMAAIEKALQPMSDDIIQLTTRVDALESEHRQMTGARRLGVWLLQTVIAAVSAVIAVFALGRHP